MDFLLSSQPLAVRFFVAFLVVLVLIGIAAWLVRRFSASRLGGTGRGRQPRLAVIDAASVDGRRRLVLIRRDNIEHLLMIGGPTDVVIEPNIVRAALGRDTAARGNGHEPARATPPLETAWPLQPINEPLPAAPSPRAPRASAVEEPWLPSEPGSRARPIDSLGGFDSPAKRAAPDLSAASPRLETAPNGLPAAAQRDPNLDNMAEQLEAALRRTPTIEVHPPVTDALAMPPSRAPILKPAVEAKLETRPEPKLEIEPKVDAKAEPKSDGVPKSVYDNLEEEMASLLGRSPAKP